MWPVGGVAPPPIEVFKLPSVSFCPGEGTGVSGSPGWGGHAVAWLSVSFLGMNSRGVTGSHQPGPVPVIGRAGVWVSEHLIQLPHFTVEDLVLVSGAS